MQTVVPQGTAVEQLLAIVRMREKAYGSSEGAKLLSEVRKTLDFASNTTGRMSIERSIQKHRPLERSTCLVNEMHRRWTVLRRVTKRLYGRWDDNMTHYENRGRRKSTRHDDKNNYENVRSTFRSVIRPT